MVEVAYTIPVAILIFRAFMASILSEIDEESIMDGASPLRVFFSIILPLLKPAIITVIVTAVVGIHHDFAPHYVYVLPAADRLGDDGRRDQGVRALIQKRLNYCCMKN